MTWTYDNNPGTGDASGRRDAVRVLIGDTDTNDQLVTDEEIAFFLSEANDVVYMAAARAARQLEALFARKADTSLDEVSVEYGEISDRFAKLAVRLESDSARFSGGLGVPIAGGIRRGSMDDAEEDDDRVRPAFRVNQFNNPPDASLDEEDWE